MARLEAAAVTQAQAPDSRGVRIVIDVRPLQEPERSPLTAAYLDNLLRAFAAAPLEGKSFVLVTRTLRDDPTERLAAAGLPIAGHRRIPPTTRALRSAGLTLDSFLLRGAELGVAVDDEPAVFHTAGGAVPLASRLPVVATLLDLAPWELPETYAATAAARFGHRLRARVLHDAARVIVCSRATAEEARRHLHLPQERMSVIPLAVDEEFRTAGRDEATTTATRARLRVPDRYLVFAGRYDARKDVKTLFAALAAIRDQGKPEPTLIFAVDKAHREDAELVVRGAARYGLRRDRPGRDRRRCLRQGGCDRRRARVRLPRGIGRNRPSGARGAVAGRARDLLAHRRSARGRGQLGDRGVATRRRPSRGGDRGHLEWRRPRRAAANADPQPRRIPGADLG